MKRGIILNIALLCFPILAGTENLQLDGFDRKDFLGEQRAFHLATPEPGRPFSGYFTTAAPLDLRMQWSDGFRSFLKITPGNTSFRRAENRTLKPPVPSRSVHFRNGCLELSGGFPIHRIYLKPNLDALDDDVLNRLDLTPFGKDAPELFHMRIERTGDGAAFYFNGSYAGTIRRGKAYPTALILYARGGERFADQSKPEIRNGNFIPVDLKMRSRNDLKGTIRLKEPLSVPMDTAVSHALDLRKSEKCGSIRNLYHSRDLARSAFDSLPMSYLFSVPAGQYSRAWVLCAPLNGAEKSSEFRLAVTRYAPYGRDEESISFADTDLAVKSPLVRNVGTAELELDGKKTLLPLYLAEIPIDSGKIQDIIHEDPNSVLPFRDYLDVDLQSIDRYRSGRNPRLKERRAAVAVFGVTLEKAPVEVQVHQAERANAFHPDENPRIPVELTARRDGEYELAWNITDIDGVTVAKQRVPLTLYEGEKKQIEIPLDPNRTGWFQVDVTFAKKGGNPFYRFPATAAVLPPDTRNAGYESPYATWWFGTGSHNGNDGAPELVLPFLKKAGIRSVCAQDHSESAMEKWGITLSQIPFFGRNIFSDDRILKDDPELWRKMEADFKARLDSFVRRFPNCRQAIILHESYRGGYPFAPNLLFGKEPQKFDEKREKLERARIRAVETMCRIYRKHAPQIQLIFGNSTWAQGILEAFMARGFDASLIDYIGSEAPGGKRLPESLDSTWTTAGSAYVLRETSRLSGAKKPVTGCYEWVCRPSGQGLLKQAQLIVRDILVAHAYHFNRISVCGAIDAGTAYNHDPGYGMTAFCTRQYQPKPVYVAVATATRNLDCAEFRGALPVTDLSVHAFEFHRKDGKNVYVLWTPEHSAECELFFDGTDSGNVMSEDLFGRKNVLPLKNGTCNITASESARYFITDRRLRSVKVLKVNHPFQTAGAGEIAGSATLSAASVEADATPDARFDVYTASPFTTGGICAEPKFPVPVKISSAPNTGNGAGISVKFDVSALPENAWNEAGYTELILKKPIEVPAQAGRIGIWVKGNWSRGRLFWEITDALGRKYLSIGDPYNGAFGLVHAYENHFGYDGWRFLSFPLSPKYAVPESFYSYQWHGPDRRSAASMRPPFRVTRIILTTTAKIDRIFEMLPVKNQEITLGTILFQK